MAVGYFDVLTSVISKKNISEEDIEKHFNGWQTMTLLMNHPKAVWEANQINSARGNKFITKAAEYKALKGLISIPKNTFLKSDKADKHSIVILNTLMKFFKVGKTTAVDYFKILPGKEITRILDLYARKNETHMNAKSLNEVKDIRAALTAKRKFLESKGQ